YPSGMAGGLALKGHPELEACALGCLIKDVYSPGAPVRIPSPLGHSSLKYAFAVPLKSGDGSENEPAGRKSPDFRQQEDISRYADTGGGLCWDCPGGSWRVYCFFTRANYEGTYLCRTIRSPHRVVNGISKAAVRRFIDVTYGKYGKWLNERLGRDIEAIFADEPGLLAYTPYPKNFDPAHRTAPSVSIVELPDPAIPVYPFIHWSEEIEDKFLKQYGYSLTDNLPEIFDGESEKACGMRLDYRRCTAGMFDEAYNRQYAKFTESKKMSYSGHFRSIRHMLNHADTFGDVLHNLGQMHIPGCDRLDSDPAAFRYRIDCKLASSAAHIYGRKHAMIEASHMYNTKEELKPDLMLCSTAVDFAQGINIITSYYGENVLKEDEYKTYSAFVSRMSALFSEGLHQIQALLYYPYEQIAFNLPVMAFDSPAAAGGLVSMKEGSCYAKALGAADSFIDMAGQLIKKQIDFDMINDEKLAECRINCRTDVMPASVVSPNGEMSHMLIFPDIDFVCDRTAEFIGKALDAGIFTGFMGRKRTVKVRKGAGEIEEDAYLDTFDTDRIVFIDGEADLHSEDFRTDEYCPGLLCMHKKYNDNDGNSYDLYLLVNTDRQELSCKAGIPEGSHGDFMQNGNISLYGSSRQPKVSLLDPVLGKSEKLEYSIRDGRICFDLTMPANNIKILMKK
ncbi:MAG: glycosyl hydrolase, partial [Eubacteriales bacterium]|nr:glycosyl hydrolase [Eubacteriales bacterium]